MKYQKIAYSILGLLMVILFVVGGTYAYWLVTKTQEKKNVVSTACLDIDITGEANDIMLTEQYPISDEEGASLTPYEFTVTNKCDTAVDYQIALELIETEKDEFQSSSIKAVINNNVPKVLSDYNETEVTIEGAYESRILGMGTLQASGTAEASETNELRLWIDKDAPISELNKMLKSKITVTAGQGREVLKIPFDEGTLAYNILSNYGGADSIQTLSAEWSEGTYGTATNLSMTKNTSYYWGTEMDFNENNGKYKLSGIVVQATTAECRNGQKTDGTAITCSYTLKNSNDAEYETTPGYKVTALTSSSITDTSNYLYITVQKTGTASNPFSNVPTASDAGLYKTTDDLGDSYYFRGAPTNNYVEFGTYAEDTTLTLYDSKNWEEKTVEVKAGSPMYWRIVRINGDGSIRLIYDGTELVENGTAHTATIKATAYDEGGGLGYTKNGTQTDSTVKDVIDEWYEANLKTNYGSYIEDGIFCNDLSGETTIFTGITPNENPSLVYAPYFRLNYKTPVLTCANKEDRYTVKDTTNGNGLLENPVGLLTADEAVMAGGIKGSNNKTYYLYSGESYLTSSPSGIYANYIHSGSSGIHFMGWDASVLIVDDDGDIGESGFNGGARPVINLKADTPIEGKGTIDNPYKLASQN